MNNIYSYIDKVRQKTPLGVRQKIGPILAHIWFYVHKINPYYKRPKVLSIEQTIRKILSEKLSVIRFGDGEISMIDGSNIGFQKNNPELVGLMQEIIGYENTKLLICIPGIWDDLSIFKPHAYKFNMHHIYRHGHVWKKLLSYSRVYGDTNMTRPYLAYKDTSKADKIFDLLKELWKHENVVIIEGSKTRVGVGNDLLSNTSSINRILCPAENAFDSYQKIMNEALKISKDKLILLSLGPTAKILGFNLFKAGYRVIDIGHVDMEYEMYTRQEKLLTKVPNKYFNEINERDPIDCTDPTYLSQIISEIK